MNRFLKSRQVLSAATKFKLFVMLVVISASLPISVQAHDEDNDIVGTSDHALLPRLSGGYIAAYERFSFSPYQLPINLAANNKTGLKTRDINGKLTRIFYRYDHAKNIVEISKKLSEILASKNFSFSISQASQNNFDDMGSLVIGVKESKLVQQHLKNNDWQSKLFVQQFNQASLSDPHREREAILLVAEKRVNNKMVYAVLSVKNMKFKHSSVAVLVDIIETDSDTPTLKMNAVSIANEMDKTSRASIEGLQFQPAKIFLTQDSKFALEEIAQFLKHQQGTHYEIIVSGTTLQAAKERANQIHQALVLGWGIARTQIVTKGLLNNKNNRDNAISLVQVK